MIKVRERVTIVSKSLSLPSSLSPVAAATGSEVQVLAQLRTLTATTRAGVEEEASHYMMPARAQEPEVASDFCLR